MIVSLNERSLLEVSGTEAQDFLQGQLSNDINSLQSGYCQLNAYCQHQGKVIALILLFSIDSKYYLSIPSSLKDVVQKRLQMFVMMSDVLIKDVSTDYAQFGAIDEKIEGSFVINERQSLVINHTYDSEANISIRNEWDIACIDMGLAEVYDNTTDRFVPQMLNLDIGEIGVSFSKGCYPGQEVVARLHYLGKAKRRMYKFRTTSAIVGDELSVEGSVSLRPSGVVVRCVISGDEYVCLATLEVEHKDDKIYLNNGNEMVRIVDA